MRLSVTLGHVGMGAGSALEPVAVAADRLGYDTAWVAEVYGSDAPTIMTWVASRTETINVGSAVLQIPARTPAMTAMTAATLDYLSGGRVRLGLGVSGPQVSEGWHGVRFDAPLERTREYVEIVRAAIARERVEYAGRHYTLPLPGGPGKALRLTLRPPRERIPIYLAAIGPRNLRLTGEIADGWLGIFFSPEHASQSLDLLREGRRAGGHGTEAEPLDGFDVAVSVPVCVHDDVEAAAGAVRAYTALYLGGMGSRTQNFYNALACRMGFAEAAKEVQDLYLEGRAREAAAAVPLEFIDATALIGPPERIAERVGRYAAAGVTHLIVAPFAPGAAAQERVLQVMREAVDRAAR